MLRSLVITAFEFLLQFSQFLAHLVPDVGRFLPVEAHVARLVLHAIRLDDGWQRVGHSREHTLVAIALPLLHLFPGLLHGQGRRGLAFGCRAPFRLQIRPIDHLSLVVDGHIRGRDRPGRCSLGQHRRIVPVDEGVTKHQFVALMIADVGDVEVARLIAEHGVEDHMLHHVSQLLHDLCLVATGQSCRKRYCTSISRSKARSHSARRLFSFFSIITAKVRSFLFSAKKIGPFPLS